MEMKKLHMGTMSYGFDSMDEVAHQLAVSFETTSTDPGLFASSLRINSRLTKSIATPNRRTSVPTGMQLASRGRRDMSSRVRDVVLSLALCHNVSSLSSPSFSSNNTSQPLGNTGNERRRNSNISSIIARRSSHRNVDAIRRSHIDFP
jgi:hypothetical protein